MNKLLAALLALGFVSVATAAASGALRGPPPVPVTVTPASGSPTTHFLVGYRTPDRLGRYAGSERRDVLSATNARAAGACIQTVEVSAPGARKGARIRIVLDPARHSGRWCAGTYRGQIEETQTPVCAPGRACPDYVLLRGVVGRFTFRVRTRPSDA